MYLSEEALIAGLQQNDREAFTQLYDEYFTVLCYFASRIINNKEEAEDIVINTFSKFWAMRANFESQANIKAFLYIVTRNNCLDYLQYKRKQISFEKEYAYFLDSDGEEKIERVKIESELLRKIYAEIQHLPPKCKQIFTLTYFDGLKANEISEQLNISVSTVTSQRARAISLLRSVLSSDEWMLFCAVAMLCPVNRMI
jgi:RNA polymerase sigma-70 factor (family 1)